MEMFTTLGHGEFPVKGKGWLFREHLDARMFRA